MSNHNGNGYPPGVVNTRHWDWGVILTALAIATFWIGFIWWILSLV